MIIVPTRRAFLTGLVSACAAPAIVTSAGIRPGLWLPRCHERWIAAYDIRTDQFIIRADFAKHELHLQRVFRVIPPHLVARIREAWRTQVEYCTERALRPGFHQHCFDWTVAAMRAGPDFETSLDASIEKALKLFGGGAPLRLGVWPSGVRAGRP